MAVVKAKPEQAKKAVALATITNQKPVAATTQNKPTAAKKKSKPIGKKVVKAEKGGKTEKKVYLPLSDEVRSLLAEALAARSAHVADGVTLETTLDLRRHTDDLQEGIDAISAKLHSDAAVPVKIQLGEALMAGLGEAPTAGRVADLVKSWAKRGDKEISKIDFRQSVRRWLAQPDTREVDELFIELDADGSGQLDVAELTCAMKQLIADARECDAGRQRMREQLDSLQERLARTREVAASTLAAEVAQKELHVMRERPPVESRVGELLVFRNAKIGMMVSRWESSKGDCRLTVNREQFRRNLKAKECGVGIDDASDEEIDGLFGRLDANGSGSIDAEELKDALGRLKYAALADERNVAEQQEAVTSLWRAAADGQRVLRDERAAERAKRRAAEEATAAVGREKAAAAEAERARKEEAAAVVKRRKIEEQAAFDAKVRHRRAAGPIAISGMIAVAITAPAAAPPTGASGMW